MGTRQRFQVQMLIGALTISSLLGKCCWRKEEGKELLTMHVVCPDCLVWHPPPESTGSCVHLSETHPESLGSQLGGRPDPFASFWGLPSHRWPVAHPGVWSRPLSAVPSTNRPQLTAATPDRPQQFGVRRQDRNFILHSVGFSQLSNYQAPNAGRRISTTTAGSSQHSIMPSFDIF